MNTIDTARIDTENAPGALESPWVFPGNVDTRLSYKTSNAGLLSWELRMKILCLFCLGRMQSAEDVGRNLLSLSFPGNLGLFLCSVA